MIIWLIPKIENFPKLIICAYLVFIKYEQFDIQGINGVEKMLTFF